MFLTDGQQPFPGIELERFPARVDWCSLCGSVFCIDADSPNLRPELRDEVADAVLPPFEARSEAGSFVHDASTSAWRKVENEGLGVAARRRYVEARAELERTLAIYRTLRALCEELSADPKGRVSGELATSAIALASEDVNEALRAYLVDSKALREANVPPAFRKGERGEHA
ncbi:MAG TPA: hypothetical protein VE987_13000 [Polyangiaceae bacterium]|nr:hypothetical protein [Polyangiaceae bacterium]